MRPNIKPQIAKNQFSDVMMMKRRSCRMSSKLQLLIEYY